MKDTPITTHLLEKLGFECDNEDAASDDWLIHFFPNSGKLYISSYFEKGQDGREYLFYSDNCVIDSISTLKQLIRLLEKAVDLDYWKNLHDRYENWITEYDQSPVLYVNINEVDLINNPEHLDALCDEIKKILNI